MTINTKIDFLLIGPAHPYRGGIANTQHSLAKALTKEGYQVKLWTFTQLYPALIFPGKTQFSTEALKEKSTIERKIHAYNPFKWKAIAEEINRLQPKAVVFRYWTPFLSPCWTFIAKRLVPQIKKVALVDNWQAHEPKPWDLYFTRKFKNSMDVFTSLSVHVANQIRNETPKAVWGEMHPINKDLPLKLAPAVAKSKLQLNPQKNFLLFFGLIRSYKGLDLLLKALVNHPDKSLLIVGEVYEDIKKYTTLLKANYLQDRVKMINRFVDEEEIAWYFSAAEAVVLPYKTATQSGVVALAYHYETPLLVTDHPGLKEPLLQDHTGVICAVSEQGISKGIKEVLNLKNNQLFRENLKKTKNRYSWSAYASEWAKFIENES